MGPETPLRIAGLSDVNLVTGLIADFRDFLDSDSPADAEIEAVVSTLIDDRQTEYLLIGDPEAGFAQLRYRLSVWEGSEDAWLEDVFVREGSRGNGWGRILVERRDRAGPRPRLRPDPARDQPQQRSRGRALRVGRL